MLGFWIILTAVFVGIPVWAIFDIWWHHRGKNP